MKDERIVVQNYLLSVMKVKTIEGEQDARDGGQLWKWNRLRESRMQEMVYLLSVMKVKTFDGE